MEWYQVHRHNLLKFHQTSDMYCPQVIISDILTITRVSLCHTETAHIPVKETCDQQQACVLVTLHQQ